MLFESLHSNRTERWMGTHIFDIYVDLFVEGGDQLAAHLQLVLDYEPDH